MDYSALPRQITDIHDITVLTRVLVGMGVCDIELSVNEGFIYYSIYYKDEDELTTDLWIINLDDIQKMYEMFLSNLTNQRHCYFVVSMKNSVVPGKEYFKLGGKYNLIMHGCSMYDGDDILFKQEYEPRIIAQTESGYYTVPLRFELAGTLRKIDPIVPNFKFRKLNYYSIIDNNYMIIKNNSYYIVDPFDPEYSFICADTYNIVNVITGSRVILWPLVLIAKGTNIKLIIDALPHLSTNIINYTKYLQLYHDAKWDTYHIYNRSQKSFNILSSSICGKSTKPAIRIADED